MCALLSPTRKSPWPTCSPCGWPSMSRCTDGTELVLRHRATGRRAPGAARHAGRRGARRHAGGVARAAACSAPAAGTPICAGTASGSRLRSIDPGLLARPPRRLRPVRAHPGLPLLPHPQRLPGTEDRRRRAGRRGPRRLVPGGPFRGDRAARLHRVRRRRLAPRGRGWRCAAAGRRRTHVAIATVQGVRFHAALSLCDVLDGRPGGSPAPGSRRWRWTGVAAPLPPRRPAGRRGRQAPPAALPVHQGRRGADPPLPTPPTTSCASRWAGEDLPAHPLRVRHAR